jgi:phosphatidylserine/phosphatidylglycerophosphate/cardiolipin synthase-like enzyme
MNNNLLLSATIPLCTGIKSDLPDLGQEILKLILSAKSFIKISALYINLQNTKLGAGQQIYNAIVSKLEQQVKVTVLISLPIMDSSDINNLTKYKNFEIVYIKLSDYYDFGVLHQKIFIIDDVKAYVGSANCDGLSFSMVGEIGYIITSQKILQEVIKIFNLWYFIGVYKNVPTNIVQTKEFAFDHKVISFKEQQVEKYLSNYNADNPMTNVLDDETSEVYLSVSPNSIAFTRTTEFHGAVKIISEAKKFVKIMIMEISDTSIYHFKSVDGSCGKSILYNEMFNAIKHAIFDRRVDVEILVSLIQNRPSIVFLRLKNLLDSIRDIQLFSMNDYIGNLTIKVIKIPDTVETNIPYNKVFLTKYIVNHSKYILTDNYSMISTSNFTPEYFNGSAGVSINTNDSMILKQLNQHFASFWNCHLTLQM